MLQDGLKALFVVLPSGGPVPHPDAHVEDHHVRLAADLDEALQGKHQHLDARLHVGK